jgi:putative sigma-54 modulation protein
MARLTGLARPAEQAHTAPDRGTDASAPSDLRDPPGLMHRKEEWMNLNISGHHLDVTPALRDYVVTKLDRVTRHFDQVVDINVLLSVEKLKEKDKRQKAEVTLHVKGRDIFVEHAHEDLYAAIDQLMDKLDRQVVRHKDRVQDHHHAAAKRMEVGLN